MRGMAIRKSKLPFTLTPDFIIILLYLGLDGNRDCPFKVAFGEGALPLASIRHRLHAK